MGSTLLTQADCSDVCVWLCVCVVVHLLMCGSQILGYSSVLMLSFKDGRYNGRAGFRCVWRARPESQGNVWHSRRHIDSYLQMSAYYQSVIFLLPHKGACSQPLKKITMSVNKCFGWPSKPADLVPFHRDSSLSEGNQLSNKTNIKETGIYTRSWYGALNSASFPIALGRAMFVESWPHTQE